MVPVDRLWPTSLIPLFLTFFLIQSSFPIVFKNGQTAQVLHVEPEQDLALVAVNLAEPCPVLVMIGGESLISEEDLQRLFSEVLAPLAEESRLIVADGGTDTKVIIN